MCSVNVEGLMGTPRAILDLIHGCWRRIKQVRTMGKQTMKKVRNSFKEKEFESEMECASIESVGCRPETYMVSLHYVNYNSKEKRNGALENGASY